MTSLAGNGGKVEESFTPDGSIPVLSLGCGVSTINVEGVDGRGSAVLGTMLVLSDAGSRLRDTCGMVATETMADAGGRRPRAGGRTRGGSYKRVCQVTWDCKPLLLPCDCLAHPPPIWLLQSPGAWQPNLSSHA